MGVLYLDPIIFDICWVSGAFYCPSGYLCKWAKGKAFLFWVESDQRFVQSVHSFNK